MLIFFTNVNELSDLIWEAEIWLLIVLLLYFLSRNVLSIDEYAACFENIDPLAPYKKWTTKQFAYQNSAMSKEVAIQDLVRTQRVKAAFILSDSVDWSRDIQVILILEQACLIIILADLICEHSAGQSIMVCSLDILKIKSMWSLNTSKKSRVGNLYSCFHVLLDFLESIC